MRVCTVCSYPPRTLGAINKCLLAGMNMAAVARRFSRPTRPISRSAIARHSKHVLSPSSEGRNTRGTMPGPSLPGDSLLDRVEGLVAENRAIMEEAKRTGQLVAATGALREQRSLLELMAKLSGELSSANVNFFAMEMTKERVVDFIEAAALRPPDVGLLIRDEAMKRFGNVVPSITVNFVKPPERNGDTTLVLPAPRRGSE